MKHVIVALLLAGAGAVSADAAIFNAKKHFEYIQHLYDRHDRHLHDLLLTEIDQYIALYPDGAELIDAYFLAGKVLEEKGDRVQAVAAHLRTIFLFSGSPHAGNPRDEIKRLIAEERRYNDVRATVLAQLEAESSGSIADRYFAYLQFLVKLNVSRLHDWLLRESAYFVRTYPAHVGVELGLLMIADVLEKDGQERQAAAAYLKLEYLAAESQVLAYARYKRGLLLYDALKEEEEAKRVFKQLAQEQPESEYAPGALFMLGDLEEKRQKNYTNAINDYRMLVSVYPEHDQALEALWRIADINDNRLGNYVAAIATYEEIVQRYPENRRAVEALEAIAKVHASRLNDYLKAAEAYARIAELQPNYDKAPDRLYDAGALLEQRGRDNAKALAYYEKLVEKYPDHRRSRDARRKIDRLRAQVGEQQ